MTMGIKFKTSKTRVFKLAKLQNKDSNYNDLSMEILLIWIFREIWIDDRKYWINLY